MHNLPHGKKERNIHIFFPFHYQINFISIIISGNPGPASLTLCYKFKSESTYRPFVGTATKVTFTGETPENMCRLRQSFSRNYIVRSRDMAGRNFFCEISNTTNPECSLVPSIASIFNLTAVSLSTFSSPGMLAKSKMSTSKRRRRFFFSLTAEFLTLLFLAA